MAANKQKQNMRFQITSRRLQNKVRYDGFSEDEIKLIKAQKKREQFDKSLNQFWKTAIRKENGSVDWDSMNDKELDFFEHIDKEYEKAMRQITRLEKKGINSEKVMHQFMMLNVKSASY